MAEADPALAWQDVRGIGFAKRAPLARAWAWLDAVPSTIASETVAASDALGRVLAADIVAGTELPPTYRAAIDGYAVPTSDTEGAGVYNPLSLMISGSVGGSRAVPISAGVRMPPGTDAVLGFTTVSRPGPDRVEVLEQAAPGEGVVARGSAVGAGAVVLMAGRRLRPQDVALLAMLQIGEVPVRCKPRVRLAIAGPKGDDAEALESMLRALVMRDGGLSEGGVCTSLAAAVAAAGAADILLVVGRSAAGEDDLAALALVEAGGVVALHGIALRPGASSGLGSLHEAPVLLLPGAPLACLVAYDMLAGRLIRRLGGRAVDFPYAHARLPLARKIVSAVGFTDVVPVVLTGEKVAPAAAVEGGHLLAACRSLGFVVVPDALEGHAEGESPRVFLYDRLSEALYQSA